MRYLSAVTARGSSARSIIYLVLSFLLVAALVPGSALLGLGAGAAQADVPPPLVVLPATVSVDPFSKSIAVGTSTTVNIKVENIPTVATNPLDGSTVPAGLYGAEVHLTFNPAQVQVVDANPAVAGVQIAPVTFGVPAANTFVAQNTVNNAAGTIDFAVTLLDPQVPVTGGGILATIPFQCVAAGTSPVDFGYAAGPPIILVGVVNFGTPTEDIIPISAIPQGGEIRQGQAPPQYYNLNVAVVGNGVTVPAVGVHSYPAGTVVNLDAIPGFGWSFQNWAGPVAAPNANHTTVTMDAVKTVTANFTQSGGGTYTLTMAVNPAGSGTTMPPIGPNPGFAPGSVVPITATPFPGWTFVNWTGPVANPNSASTTVLMDVNNKIVTANFTQSGGGTYTLTMAVNPAGSGTTAPPIGPNSGFAAGTVVPITATPNAGWTFLNWIGPVANPANPSTTVTMNSNVTVTANFTQGQVYTLTLASNGSGGTMPGTGPHNYPAGSEAKITATPADTWTFVNWTGGPAANPNSPSTTVLMDANKTVTANFVQGSGQMYTLTVAQTGNGNVVPGVGTHSYPASAVIGIGGMPAPGWTFVNWTGDPVSIPNASHTTIVMNGNKSITANFTQGTTTVETDSYPNSEVEATLTPPSGGPVTLGPAALSVARVNFEGPTEGDANDSDGDGLDDAQAELLQLDIAGIGPAAGVRVRESPTMASIGQIEEDANNNPGRLDVPPFGPSGSTVHSFFDVFVELSTDGGATWTPGVAPLHLQGTLTHKPAAAGDFYQGPPGGGVQFSTPGGMFVLQIAKYTPNPGAAQTYTLTMAVSGSGTTTPTEGAHPGYAPGTVVNVSATPASGWAFVDWTGPVANATSASTTVTMDADKTVTANFTEQSDVPLSLLAAENNVTVGQTFSVTINTTVDATQQVSAVDAFVDFDPAKLEVVDSDDVEPGIQVAPGTQLPMSLNNAVDNGVGHVDFSAGKLSAPFPTGSFLVATITFRAKAETDGPTPIVFSLAGTRTSIVAHDGVNLPGSHADSSATITFDTPLSLLPAATHSYVDTNFTITIETNAPAGQQVSAVDAFIDFDPVYLEVVDSDPVEPGIQVAPGANLPMALNNAVDNALGHVDFSAGKLSAPFPDGSFLVATITFRAKAETPGTNVTPITVSLAGARKSLVAFDGSPVPGTHADADVDIDPGATIIGHLTLQGGSRPASKRVLPITVKLFSAGQYAGNTIMSGTPAMTYTPSTVDTGSNNVTFQIDGIVAGTYDILVVTGHTLHNVKRGVVVNPPTVDVFFGSLLEGNSNNDGIINAIDFSILAASYLKSTGQAGWDARADYDMTGTVNALDFSLLASNYLKFSPLEQP